MIDLGEILKISSSAISLLSYFTTKNSFCRISSNPHLNSAEMYYGEGEEVKLGQGVEDVSKSMVQRRKF